ncbi:MAG TPA: chemotaxis protein CheW [Candidatus Krumholzibacteria bacterium]|nr:chemotaxis protein CheW [Candidatus Krumholzibacteria bacterium]
MAERQFVSLKVGGRMYGMDILLVREIIRDFAFTRVETPLECVLGLLNLRGQIITVVDAGALLGLPPRDLGPGSRCVILKTAGELAARRQLPEVAGQLVPDAVGLVVDGIADVVQVDTGAIDAPPANTAGANGRYLEGVVRLQDGLLQILAVGPLLADVATRQGTRASRQDEARSVAR